MIKRKIGSCTTLLVGKKAALDGAPLIARNEDSSEVSMPQRFLVINPEDQPSVYHGILSGVEIPLPENPLRYTSAPDADESAGIWAAAGINSANIAMTASETITTNSRILGVDPLVDNGLGEADMVTITLPYIHSAKEGVLRLGQLLAQYGTYESNGIAFADAEEIWYMETIGGHHWAAVRIPDDAYVIAPNRLNIDHFDFESPDTLYSEGLPELIEKYHLNPDMDQVNLRHIFGSANEKDIRYNNPRAWYIQKHFSGSTAITPLDHELPFICNPVRKLSIEDVKWALSSHFQNTPYDPYGNGTAEEKCRYRPIAINRNQQLHILQIRPDMPTPLAGIHWLAFGPNTFNAVVPFYAHVTQTPTSYRDGSQTYDPANSFWLSHTLALIGDHHYDLYAELHERFELKTMAACRQLQLKTDAALMQEADPTAELEAVNETLANIFMENGTTLLGEMVMAGTKQMTLRFSMKD